MSENHWSIISICPSLQQEFALFWTARNWKRVMTSIQYEGKLVKQVLMEILKTLNIGSLDVAKHPVGLKQRTAKLNNLLRTSSNDKSVCTVGIWGKGGIGKTTLSKAVCNDIKSMFDAFCFVSDVRERAKESIKGLTELQEQIMKDLLKIELKVNSVHEGQVKKREHLGSIRALHNQALELFSWHAFLRVCPDEGYEDLSKRVVKACKGLPLSLELMGAHLYDKRDDTAFWNEAVIRIESMMDKDLYETLKISFNGLRLQEPTYPHTAIENLSLKSLIRVKKYAHDNSFFDMHDHLRDLGREIVAEESREDPCKRSRLWHPHDVRRVVGESKEITNLRGFKCCNFLENVFSMESLALMKNMQFLWLENVQLVGQEKTQFPPKAEMPTTA
eukprot:Gb_12959 [translate_table: standard]